MEVREKRPEWLLDFKSDAYSQAGEDGIIKKILETIPANDKWCVEFGAWDGIYLSNVRNLIENAGYSAVLIEGSKTKYDELCKNYSSQKNIACINAFVGFSGPDNLDRILNRTSIPKDFDVLSIDIDGNDYHVWKAISEYKPKLVVIEFNQTIPTEIRFVQKADFSVSQGASLRALVELGKQKGYELLSVLSFNAFFIRSEYFPLFEIGDNSPETLRKSLEDITYIFSGYDGKILLHGNQTLPWHGIKIKQSKIQQLPKVLQKFPCNYNKFEKILWYIWLAFYQLRENPLTAAKKIILRLSLWFR